MKTFERHEVYPYHLAEFMAEHVNERIIFRETHQNLVCLDIEREMSKAEFNMEVLNDLLKYDTYVKFVEEEKAAIEYAIECIKTLDEMGIIKENNDD